LAPLVFETSAPRLRGRKSKLTLTPKTTEDYPKDEDSPQEEDPIDKMFKTLFP